MSKGKKFDAAEKHFMKKEAIYRRMLDRNNVGIKELQDKIVELDLMCKNLQKENEMLNVENNKLLEYTGLDKKDIKMACKKDTELTKLMRDINIFGKYTY